MKDRKPTAVAIALAAALAGLACGPRTPPPDSSLVLVTLDTFRADHLGSAGHPSIRTPHLDRLARRGIQWSEAVSAIPLTTPSHATILTGLSPRAHGLLKNRMALDSTRVTLAEALAERGVRTAAVVSNGTVLGPDLGLNQGFARYEVVEPAQLPASGDGTETARVAREMLSEGGERVFLWVHFFDAHLPYLPPPPFDQLYLQGAARDTSALYAGEVSFLDSCVGSLARAVERSGRAERTALLVTADHGEGLGEHGGYFGHDVQLYDSSLRVPMILAGGGVTRDPRPRRDPARTMDVTPTILGLLGKGDASTKSGAPANAGVAPAMEGRDLLHDPPPSGDALLFVAETHPAREKSSPIYAIRTGNHKVIWEPRHARHEYYDLALDPAERLDLAKGAPPHLQVLAEDLELDLRNRPVGRTQTIDDLAGGADAKTRAALESLGYVGN